MTLLQPSLSLSHIQAKMDLLTASLDEEFIELVNATLGRWMPARVRNMSYSDYFNVLCPLMCSEAVCDYFKKLGLLRQPLSPAARTKKNWLVESSKKRGLLCVAHEAQQHEAPTQSSPPQYGAWRAAKQVKSTEKSV